MSRAEKRERAGYHDSRRWLKRHSPRRSDPLLGIREKAQWSRRVHTAVAMYPKWSARQRAELDAGGLRTSRRGPSAEEVVLRGISPPVLAVEKALGHFRRCERRRLHMILWGGAPREKTDRAMLGLFYRYVAVYLGYGRSRYDLRSS